MLHHFAARRAVENLSTAHQFDKSPLDINLSNTNLISELFLEILNIIFCKTIFNQVIASSKPLVLVSQQHSIKLFSSVNKNLVLLLSLRSNEQMYKLELDRSY